jgi:tyrosyl-tRNA synthetase
MLNVMELSTDKEAISELLTRGVNEVIDKKHLEEQLLSGKQLRVKLGIDPTSPNLHIGRSVTLLKLRDFQKLGHQVVFIVGDFTGVIGDTSDKESERKMLEEQEIAKNMKTYVEQAGKILDLEKAEVQYNSSWLKKLGFAEIGRLANYFSLAEFIARENISKRLKEGSRVSLRELLYPLMQGYDSVAVKSDVELGGTDQRFNLLAGREIQKHYGQESQDIVMTNLVLGTDGRKMSSSWGNTINLTDAPNDMFGKVMSVPDGLIVTYFEHCTRLPMEQVETYAKELKAGKTNPRDIKMALASELVKMYAGEAAAKEAQDYFVNVFQKKTTPDEMPTAKVAGMTIVDALVESKIATSKTKARQLVEQGAVKIDEEVVKSIEQKVKTGNKIQKGKRFFVRVG